MYDQSALHYPFPPRISQNLCHHWNENYLKVNFIFCFPCKWMLPTTAAKSLNVLYFNKCTTVCVHIYTAWATHKLEEIKIIFPHLVVLQKYANKKTFFKKIIWPQNQVHLQLDRYKVMSLFFGASLPSGTLCHTVEERILMTIKEEWRCISLPANYVAIYLQMINAE